MISDILRIKGTYDSCQTCRFFQERLKKTISGYEPCKSCYTEDKKENNFPLKNWKPKNHKGFLCKVGIHIHVSGNPLGVFICRGCGRSD